MVSDWARAYRGELQDGSSTVQDREQLTANLERRIEGLNRVADQIYSAWLGREN